MKHQVAFVGGQLLPVVIGIKEFAPDRIHFVVSEETKHFIDELKLWLSGKVYSINICDPFDFNSIKSTCEGILNRIERNDEVKFNLTGGTKIMVLAGQSLMSERAVSGFYVNQSGTVLYVPAYEIKRLNTQISVKEFFEISGHKLSNVKSINDFTNEDLRVAREIEAFAQSNSRLFYKLNSAIRKKYVRLDAIPFSGHVELNKSTVLSWDGGRISLKGGDDFIFRIESLHSRSLFFNASWWELIVAKEVSRWPKAKELFVQCELPFKGNVNEAKNEIDILINLGGKLIFIECKSGVVKQSDINKMKVVKDTYGGIVSRSVLVSRFRPDKNIAEKCKELNIDIFYLFENQLSKAGETPRTIQINAIGKLLPLLERVEKKLMI